MCALAGAITIAVQLPAGHWFYYYIVWFVPFVIVALLAQADDDGTLHEAPGGDVAAPPLAVARTPEAVQVGV